MSLMVESLGTRGRVLSSIGIPLRLPARATARPSRVRTRAIRRFLEPLAGRACEVVETSVEAAGFGLLLSLFLMSIYLLG